MRSGFWKADWILGVAVAALSVLFSFTSAVLPGLERNVEYGDALTAIDQQSINLER